MALILPGQQNTGGTNLNLPASTSGSKLVLPGTTEAEKLSERLPIRRNLALEQRQTAADASRSTTSRFLEELGINLKDLGKEIVQGTARSFGAVGQAALTQSLDTPIRKPVEGTTARKIFNTIYGDRDVSIKAIGEDLQPLVESLGVSKETASRFAIPLGLFGASLDVIPGLPGKKKALETITKELAEQVVKTTDERLIRNALRTTLKGDEEVINTLANGLRQVDNVQDAQKIIDASLKEGKLASNIPSVTITKQDARQAISQIPVDLRRVADDIARRNLDEARFLDELNQAIKKSGTATHQAAIQTIKSLDELGISVAKFAEIARVGGSEALDRVAREVLSVPVAKRVVKTEETLLKERIKNLSRGAKEGAKAARDNVYRIQTDVINLINDQLPQSLRGSLLKTVRNANSVSKLDNVLETIGTKVSEFENLQALQKQINTREQKIGFLKKVGEFNQTAIRHVKKTVGIDKPIKKMSIEELDKMIGELKTRFSAKAQAGLLKTKGEVPTSLTQEQIDAYVQVMGGEKSFATKARKAWFNTKETLRDTGDIITLPSEALRGINAEDVLFGLRKMGDNAKIKTKQAEEVLSPIIEKFGLNKMTRTITDEDYFAIDLAMKNRAIDTVMDIAKKYGVEKEFKKLRGVLDDTFTRANEVGLDVGYLENVFPRSFKNDAASRQFIVDFFDKNYGDVIQQAKDNFFNTMGTYPNDEEMWGIISNLMRGFKQQGVTLSKTGSFKNRVIDIVEPELAPYYHDSFTALQGYFESANNLIEARRFFGKHLTDKVKDLPGEADMKNVVGVLIQKLVKDGSLDPKNSSRLQSILEARFTGGESNLFVRTWKNASYLTIMGDIFSAITQIGDFEKVMYKAGVRESLPAIWRSVFNPSAQELRLADYGLEKTIAAEMSSPSKMAQMVNTVFKTVGLSWVDRLGKEAFLNGVLSKYRKAAISGDTKFLAYARRILGEEADEAFDALRRGEITENVRFVMLNELADFFPITLEEVPLAYLRHPNGRLFYAMKTYTTKQLNTYNREIVRKWNSGEKADASVNAARMIGFLLLMNSTADEIKDFLQGKDEPVRDKVVDNMLKVFGFNRYALDRAQQLGAGRAVVEQILPPTTFIDDAGKDFYDVFVAQKDDVSLRSTRNIPPVGELYYWWFGRGSEQNKPKKSTGGLDIPTVEIPSIEIPTIEI